MKSITSACRLFKLVNMDSDSGRWLQELVCDVCPKTVGASEWLRGCLTSVPEDARVGHLDLDFFIAWLFLSMKESSSWVVLGWLQFETLASSLADSNSCSSCCPRRLPQTAARPAVAAPT